MVKFVSIDSSTTSTGICLWENNKLVHYRVLQPKHKEDTGERIYEMTGLIMGVLDEWQPQAVFCETPQGHGANVKLARMLGQVLGCIIGWCANHKIEYMEMNPSVWRKWNGWEQGKLTRPELKAMSLKMAKERAGVDCKKCDDLADAINIGLGVIRHFER